MTTLETVIRVAFVIINSIAFCTVCIILSKWLRRIEDKTDELKEAVYTDIARGSFAYLEFLYRYKEQLERKENYLVAAKIQKVIELETLRLQETDIKTGARGTSAY